jgi:hypothetical protein
MDPTNDWNRVYANRAATELSWYQPHAERSLALIRRITDGRPFHLIDVGVTTAALPAQAYDLWHDRAVFHFLTDASQRAAYLL